MCRLGRCTDSFLVLVVPCTIVQNSSPAAELGARFLDTAAEDRLGTLAIIALSLGLRKGEACGLKPDDVDLETRVLRVRRTLSWAKMPGDEEGRWVERQPKRGSMRDLLMTETICRALVRHISRRNADAMDAGDRWKDSGYLFVSPTGAPLHGSNVTEVFHQICDRASVPRIRFHDTRHTCGTLLHVQGADIFVIKQVLGHAQLSTTKRYTHVPIEVTRQALEGLESLFAKAAKEAESVPVTVKTTIKSDRTQIQ